MKLKRTVAALLAAVTMAGSLAACAETDQPNNESQPDTQAAETEADTGIRDNLPSTLNYGGEEITFISRYLEGWTSGEIAVPDIKSEPVNDAVFERNKDVESRLNVKINSIENDGNNEHEVVSKVSTAVKAGTHEYDVMAAACYAALPETLNGSFVNLRSSDLTYLDFEKPWWSQGFNDVMEYSDTQFVITGDALITLYRMAFVTVFNQKLFDDADQTYLYEYVDNGTWTLDQQISMVPLFHRDNGNGVQDDQGDVYGFVTGTVASVDGYWSSCRVDIIKKNEDGIYEVVLDLDKIHGLADKLLKLYHETDGASRIITTGGYAGYDEIRDLFSVGNAAMATLHIMALESASMRKMEDKYGVVPMPKYDEKQDGYNTLLHDQFTVFAVPTTVVGERLSMVSAVLEAMGSASYRIVKPAYYETTLRTKLAQDPQSAEMMDIIIRNIYIDAGIIYTGSLPGYQGALRELVVNKQNDAVSRFTVRNKTAKKSLNEIVNKLDGLANR